MLSNDRFIELFELQHNLQTETYGFNFQQMLASDRIQYVKDMKLALEAELQEALDETQWQPWTKPRGSWVDRDAYVGELVDVLHFFINMLLVLGDDPSSLADEVFVRYTAKRRVNQDRQRDHYDGVSTKCGGCARALDDNIGCTRRGDQGFCIIKNADINYLTRSTLPAVRDTVEP